VSTKSGQLQHVVDVADGDTITVLDSNKDQHKVRIAGIVAPEKGQPFGTASRKRLSELLGRKEVRVEFQKYDRYGRIVGKVWATLIYPYWPEGIRADPYINLLK
jgi:endonuclease YncB( thermonuclease family)